MPRGSSYREATRLIVHVCECLEDPTIEKLQSWIVLIVIVIFVVEVFAEGIIEF